MLIGLRFLSPVVGIPFVEIWGDTTTQSNAMKYAASIMEAMEKIVFKYEPPERTEENKDVVYSRLVLQAHEVRRHRKRAVAQLFRHLETKKGTDLSLMDTGIVFELKDKGRRALFVSSDLERFLWPCGHRILCRQCTLNIQLVNPRCPVCREWIGSTATSIASSDSTVQRGRVPKR